MKTTIAVTRSIACVLLILIPACDPSSSEVSVSSSPHAKRLLKHFGGHELALEVAAPQNAKHYEVAVIRFQDGKPLGPFFIHPGSFTGVLDHKIRSSFVWHKDQDGTVRASLATNELFQSSNVPGDWWKFESTLTASKAPSDFRFNDYLICGFATDGPALFEKEFGEVLGKSKRLIALAIRWTDSDATAKSWSDSSRLVRD